MQKWTVDQVMAAAPDSSSQVAGRKLARPGPWSALGCTDGVLWGECQGSGKTPYRVTVDTGTRRYQCSCPSRKFPCKHGLGLLFLWAEGQLDASGEIADFARDFAARGEPATDTAEKATAPLTQAQLDAAVQRAERRELRVADGLAELDRWLTDQVGAGLARAAQHPYGWAETMAARMVDAQAPGVAAWLRRLPAVITSGEGWPSRLLDELGLMHLLARSFAARRDLADDLLATVREHIGFTVSRAEVSGRPAIRDEWAVVGLRDLDTESVSTRRVWLHGRATDTWAQVLFFAAAGQTMDTSLLPGTVLDADLHFYPGRAGLRAVVGEQYAEPVALTQWAPQPDSIEAAATRWATALAADPWQHQIPVVLHGVVDVTEGTWTLTDDTGAAISMHGTELDLWRLLAITMSAPSTVFGEWSPSGFRPAAVVDGRLVGL